MTQKHARHAGRKTHWVRADALANRPHHLTGDANISGHQKSAKTG